MSPEALRVIRALASWKLLTPIALYALYAFGVVWLAHRFGLWESSVLKDTVITGVFVGVPMLFRAPKVREGTVFVRQVVRETIGISALIAFYLNLASLPLWGELVLQPTLTLLSLVAIVARNDPKHAPVRRLSNFLLGAAGLALLAYTTIKLVTDVTDTELGSAPASLAISIWLPLALLLYVYGLAFVMKAETIITTLAFQNEQKQPPWQVKFAIISGLHFNTHFAAELTGWWRHRVAHAITFREARQIMNEFRSAIRDRDKSLRRFYQHEEKHAGQSGTDRAGLVIDRREFAVTKHALTNLYFMQLGMQRNQGRFHPTMDYVLTGLTVKDLPDPHGIEYLLRNDKRAWRAWRRTPSGYVFATGGNATDLDAQWQYEGTEPPATYPSQSAPAWINCTTGPSPREWAKSDDAPTQLETHWE